MYVGERRKKEKSLGVLFIIFHSGEEKGRGEKTFPGQSYWIFQHSPTFFLYYYQQNYGCNEKKKRE